MKLHDFTCSLRIESSKSMIGLKSPHGTILTQIRTRPISPPDERHNLAENTLWWQGPKFLHDDKLLVTSENIQIAHDDPEVNKCRHTPRRSMWPTATLWKDLSISRIWWDKRAVALCLRYMQILRSRLDGNNNSVAPTTRENKPRHTYLNCSWTQKAELTS